MIAPRSHKVLRDVLSRPGRSLLAVLAMTAGVFALATISFKYSILRPVLGTMYSDTRPASATLFIDRADDSLVDSVRQVPGVGDAEARPVILARARIGENEWVPAILYVIRDFDRQRMDLFRPNDGVWPAGENDILLERAAVSVAQTRKGEDLTLRTLGGEEQSLRVAGTVHAAGLAPAWMEHVVYGFIAWNSSIRGEGSGESAQIRIRVAEHSLDEGHIREVVDAVKTFLEARGHAVARVDVPIPGRHPHADQMETFLYLLGAFGILSFLLGAVLVASMIHALMTEQVKQVGMMKAIGATAGQISGIYLGQVALLSFAALCLGLPLGLVTGRAYAEFSAGILNADVTASPFPLWTLIAVSVIGLLVPLLVALVPVVRASRITVRQALNDDLVSRPFGSTLLERWLVQMDWLPRPLMLTLRTTFLRRGRLLLTSITLGIGGAVFISALNVSGAWTRSVTKDFQARHYDLTVRLAASQPIDSIAAALATVPSVSRAEYWPGTSPYLVSASGAAGGAVAMLGVEPGSRLLDLPLVSGRWLKPGDSTAVVLNQTIQSRNPTLRVGGNVELRLAGRTLSYPIVGIVKEMFPTPVVYAPRRSVLAATGQSGDSTRIVRIVTREHTEAAQRSAARDLEVLFEGKEIEVAGIQSMLDVRKGILDHLVIIVTLLTMAATLVVIVGGLALTSMLTINVIQRTREIGVLSAIGAAPRTIATHVWIEGTLIGILSWLMANLLAVPVSYVLEAVTGQMFLRAPLEFFMSASASAIWLALVIVLASVSSFYPAWRAARLTVREAIAHV